MQQKYLFLYRIGALQEAAILARSPSMHSRKSWLEAYTLLACVPALFMMSRSVRHKMAALMAVFTVTFNCRFLTT